MRRIVTKQAAWRYGLFGLLLTVMFLFMIWPIALIVRGGFVDSDGRFTLYYIVGIFRDPVLVQGLINSFVIAAGTTLLCLIITMPLAMLAARCQFVGKSLLTSLMLVPLILPPFVGAIGFRALVGRFGSFNAMLVEMGLIEWSGAVDFLGGQWQANIWPLNLIDGRLIAVIIMEALHLYPILYLNLTAALSNLDPTLDEAAEGLGAGRWRKWRRVTLPLIMPGIFAGSTIVFIWSFTELGTPLMFDFYTVTPVQVFWGITQVQTDQQPYALVVVMFVLAILFYLLGKFALGRPGHAMAGKATIAATTRKLSRPASWLAAAAFALLIFIAVLPHIGVILSSLSGNGQWYRTVWPRVMSLGHFEQALSHASTVDSIRNSLWYAIWATAACVLTGVAVAYLTVRAKVRGRWLLDGLAMLPLAVPGLVMAFGYVAMTLHWPLGQGGVLDRWFSVLGAAPNPVPLLIIAYAIRRLPYVVRSVAAGLEQTPVAMEEAAVNLGASTLTTVRRIVLPLIMANVIAGAILAFSFSMLEVSDSLILAQQQKYFPITKAIFELYQRLGDGPYIAAALGVWGMALLTITLVGSAVLMGRKLGAIFRV